MNKWINSYEKRTAKQPNKSSNKLSSLPIESEVKINRGSTWNFYQTLIEQIAGISKWLEKQI